MPNAGKKGGKKWDGKKTSGGGDNKSEMSIDAAALLSGLGMGAAGGLPGMSANPMLMSGTMGGDAMQNLAMMSMLSGAGGGAAGAGGVVNVKMNPMQLMQMNQAVQVQARVTEQAKKDEREKELQEAVDLDREGRGCHHKPNHQNGSQVETDETSDTEKEDSEMNPRQRKRLRRRKRAEAEKKELEDCKAKLAEEVAARGVAEAQVNHITTLADEERAMLEAEATPGRLLPSGRLTRGRALSASHVHDLTPGKSSLLAAVDAARAIGKSHMVVTFKEPDEPEITTVQQSQAQEDETMEEPPPKPRRERQRRGTASPSSTEVPLKDQFAMLRKNQMAEPRAKKLTDERRAVMLVMAVKDIASDCTEEPPFDKMPKGMGVMLKIEAGSILAVVNKSKDKRQRITELESGLGVKAFDLTRRSREAVSKFMVRVLFAIGFNEMSLHDHENWDDIMGAYE